MDLDFSGDVDSHEFAKFCHKFRLMESTQECIFNSVNSQMTNTCAREMLFDDFVWLMEGSWLLSGEDENKVEVHKL